MDVPFFIGMIFTVIAVICFIGAIINLRKVGTSVSEFRVLFTFIFSLAGGVILIGIKNQIVDYFGLNPNSWGLMITAIAAFLIYTSIVFMLAIHYETYRKNKYGNEE